MFLHVKRHYRPSLTPEGHALTEAVAYRQMIAQVEAQELAALARYVAAQPPDPDGAPYGRYVPVEVAAVLKISERAASARLDLAVALARLPATFAALQTGRIDGYRARAIAEATEPLTVEQAHQVEEQVLERAGKLAPARLREALRRAVLRVDPDAAERRRQQKKTERRVEHYPDEDGQGELTIHAPVKRTQAAYDRIRAIATTLQQQGAADGRTLDQLCTDVALDLLAGKDFDNVRVQVLLTLPASTALGVDTKPGYVAGYGDVTAQAALELAAQQDATWKRILHDPATGQVLDVGRRHYRPPAALNDHVKARTRTCTAPGCTRPASKCDLDHVTPFPDGPTSDDNLGPACRNHHNAKTRGGWRIDQPEPGKYIWISPAGFRFPYKSEPIADPEPPDNQSGDPPF